MVARRTGVGKPLRVALLVILAVFLVVSLRILLLRADYAPGAPTHSASVATSWGRPFSGPQGPFTYAGAVHVHTEVSADARVPLSDVVAAAREAGLSFVVLTEHDVVHPLGARARVQDGVLLVAAVEWSASDGHLLDFSPTPSRGPYRTGVEAVAACRASGGPCVVAHPTSWRRQWLSTWQGVDGMEIHSGMAAVGDQLKPPFLQLGWTAWQTLLNPGMGLWPSGAAQERALWMHEAYAQVQPMSAWCSPDLHGHLPLRENLAGFLTLVGLPQPLDGDALVAAQQLVDALPRGVCVNALAGWVDGLRLEADGSRVRARGQLAHAAGPARLVLLKDSVQISEVSISARVPAEVEAPRTDGTWRAEIRVSAPGFIFPREHSAAVSVLRVDASEGR
ncbi:MAG: hypothetical protein AB2A00_18195 [Myxococcota bacterium]